MDFIKTNIDQFIGGIELKRIIRSLGERYSQLIIQFITDNYGIVKKDSDSSFDNLKVIAGSNANDISINSGYAINDSEKIIHIENDLLDYYQIPNTDTWYYVYIESTETNEEDGTIDISVTGQITGLNTEFTKVLRGGSNFNIKIKFTNAALNTDEYEVNSVTSDIVAQLVGTNFQAETGLKYKIVGTFMQGKIIPVSKKDIFQYDKYTIIISTNDSLEVLGSKFLLARVKLNGTVRTIEDMRTQLYYLNADSKIGDREYTEQNYITNYQSITDSLDELDIAINDIVITSPSFANQTENEQGAISDKIVSPLGNQYHYDYQLTQNKTLTGNRIFEGKTSFDNFTEYVYLDGGNIRPADGSPTVGSSPETMPILFFKDNIRDTDTRRLMFLMQASWDGWRHFSFLNIYGIQTSTINQFDQAGIGFDGIRYLQFVDNSGMESGKIESDVNNLVIKGLKKDNISFSIDVANVSNDVEDIQSSTDFILTRSGVNSILLKVVFIGKIKSGRGSSVRINIVLDESINYQYQQTIVGTVVDAGTDPSTYNFKDFVACAFTIRSGGNIRAHKLDGVNFEDGKYYRFEFSGMVLLNGDSYSDITV